MKRLFAKKTLLIMILSVMASGIMISDLRADCCTCRCKYYQGFGYTCLGEQGLQLQPCKLLEASPGFWYCRQDQGSCEETGEGLGGEETVPTQGGG